MQTLQTGCKAEVADGGGGEEVCNHKLSKAERAFAVWSSGRKNKKKETSAFVSMQVHFITRI